jgi:hypothetical protein
MPPIWYDGGSFKLYLYTHEEHQRPHVAVRIGTRNVASIDIETGDVLVGTLPPKVHKRIRELLREHLVTAVSAFMAALKGDVR